MIKWPEPFLVRHEDVCGDEVGPPTPCYTEAQLKQAVRDFGEQCAHLAETTHPLSYEPVYERIRALIKEIPA